jgi:hypothetical protein
MPPVTLPNFLGAEEIESTFAEALAKTRHRAVNRLFESEALDAGGRELAFGEASAAAREGDFDGAAEAVAHAVFSRVRRGSDDCGTVTADERLQGVFRTIAAELRREEARVIESFNNQKTIDDVAWELQHGEAAKCLRVGDCRKAVGRAFESMRSSLNAQAIHA